MLPGSGYASADALSAALLSEGSGGAAHGAVNAVLDALHSRISQLETAVETLDTLEAAVPQLEAGVAQAQQKVDELDAQIAAVQAQLDDPALTEEQRPCSGTAAGPAANRQSHCAGGSGRCGGRSCPGKRRARSGGSAAGRPGHDPESARAAYAQFSAMEDQIPADAAALTASYAQLAAAKKELDDGWDRILRGPCPA